MAEIHEVGRHGLNLVGGLPAGKSRRSETAWADHVRSGGFFLTPNDFALSHGRRVITASLGQCCAPAVRCSALFDGLGLVNLPPLNPAP